MKLFHTIAFVSLALPACAQNPVPVPTEPPAQAAAAPMQAPGPSYADLFKGVTLKSAMRPMDIPVGYAAAQINVAGVQGGGLMDMIMSPMVMLMGAFGGAGGGDKDNAAMAGVLGALELSWSSGEVVVVGGQRYLVTYKIGTDMAQLMGMSKVDNLSGAVLRLNLVRLNAIDSIIPRPDMTKEKFLAILATKLPKPAPPVAPVEVKPEQGGK